jgi:hypothetical protein
LLGEIDGPGKADPFTLFTFFSCEKETSALVYVEGCRYGLLIIHMQCLGGAKTFIVCILDGDGTITGTGATSGAKILLHVTGQTPNLCLKITHLTLERS